MILARSLMYVPGQRARMVEKAIGLPNLDIAILDLEDGVPPNHKAAARDLVAASLGRPRLNGPLRFVRVNAIDTEHFADDVAAAIRPGLDGLLLPKVEKAEEIVAADKLISERERAAKITRPTPLIAFVEGARGLLNAFAIASAARRILGLIIGAEDFAFDLGLPPDRRGAARDLLYARSSLVVAAAAAGVLAFDQVWPDIDDSDGLRRDSILGRQLGFAGKSLIHPGQIDPINEAFTPTERDVAHARRMVAAFEAAAAGGNGAIAFEGQLVDLPVVERARRLVRVSDVVSARVAHVG